MTCQLDILWKAVRVLLSLEFHPDSSVYALVENSVTKSTKIQHKSVDFFVDLDVLIWVVF